MKLPKFLIGLLIGTAVGLIIWYWQKSTSAEDGALAVLDRLASAEARVRELEGRLRLSQEQRYASEKPEVLSGITDLWGLDTASKERRSEKADVQVSAVDVSLEAKTAGDDLKSISGIGPTYERRLKDAGILTFADLAQQSPELLRTITGQKSRQLADPEKWIAEAQTLSEA